MTLSQRLRFLLWFAAADLFERRARGTTAVLVLTVALTTGSSLVLLALPPAADKVKRDRLKRSPLALCLWAGDRPLGRKLDAALVGRLRERVRAALPSPDDLVGVHPFYQREFTWMVPGPDGSTRRPTARGRTLEPGDPLLAGLPFRRGGPFPAPDAPGVVVTPGLLRQLELPDDVQELSTASPSGAAVPVPVAGVLADDLPNGDLFVLTEPFFVRLLSEDAGEPLREVRTGPLPPGWPDEFDKLPQPVRKSVLDFGWLDPLWEPPGSATPAWHLALDPAQPPQSRDDWRAQLFKVQRGMREAGFATRVDFEQVTWPPATSRPPRFDGHDRAGVTLRDLPALAPAADAVEAEGLRVNRDVIRQLAEYDGAARATALVLWAVLVVVCVIAFMNLGLIQELRGRQKYAEVGLLRAVGTPDGLLRQVYLAEAVIVWLLGVGLGALLAVGVGLVAVWRLLAPDEVGAIFSAQWAWMAAAFLAASFAVCAGSADLSTRRPRLLPPARTMGG